MRWPRQHADSSLGELMDARPEPESTVTTAVRPATTDTLDRDPALGPDPDTDGGFLDDEDYLPQERRGPGRLTVALVAALVLAVGVLGGVWLQKQAGATASPSGFAARQAAAGGFPGGTGQRGYGGAGTGTGTGAGAAGAGTGTGTGGAATGTTGGTGTGTTPAVVGTVTSAGTRSLVVTDLGGTRHTVTVAGTTTVTTPYAHGALKTGDTVAVAGRAGPDGSVAASGITVS